MNTLSICDEKWVESMESIQLTMSGYFLHFTVENEAWSNSTVALFSEHEGNTAPSIMTIHLQWGQSLWKDDERTLTVRHFWDVKPWHNDAIMFCLPHLDLRKVDKSQGCKKIWIHYSDMIRMQIFELIMILFENYTGLNFSLQSLSLFVWEIVPVSKVEEKHQWWNFKRFHPSGPPSII